MEQKRVERVEAELRAVGGGLPPPVHCACKSLLLQCSYFKPEPQSPNLDDLPCGEYIMNATLLSVDHNALQGNLFPVSARA